MSVNAPVSIREVAAHAGVSVGTVSNVLNRPDIVARPTRERVHEAIKALGFVRNESARQLRAGRSRTIGLVVLDVANPFFTDVARGVEDEASMSGLAVILCNSDEQLLKETRYLELLEEHRVQGILITPVAGAGERLARRAETVAERTFELSQLLVDVLRVEDVGAYYPHRVTYHPTCHSLRLLRVGDRPLLLLRRVAGLDLVELPDADVCCGFGGTFAVKNADTSTAMLADKMRNVLGTRAEVCTAGDSSCLMHIGGGLSRLRAGVRTVHLAEILASTRETL